MPGGLVQQARRFSALSASDRAWLLEACWRLAWAWLTIRLLPFRRITALASVAPKGSGPEMTDHRHLESKLRWALTVCARHVPFRSKCFEQGLAAQAMLRRRGIHSVLHYGVMMDRERGLIAHVWVTAGEHHIIGEHGAAGFAELAQFPPPTASTTMTET